MRNDVINISRARDKKKSLSPDFFIYHSNNQVTIRVT